MRMSDLHADAALIASLTDEGPTAPQEPPPGTPQRIIFHAGHIWRRSDTRWDTMEPADPHVLLDLYRADAKALDWFAPKAAELAEQLEQAMRDAGLIKSNRRRAA